MTGGNTDLFSRPFSDRGVHHCNTLFQKMQPLSVFPPCGGDGGRLRKREKAGDTKHFPCLPPLVGRSVHLGFFLRNSIRKSTVFWQIGSSYCRRSDVTDMFSPPVPDRKVLYFGRHWLSFGSLLSDGRHAIPRPAICFGKFSEKILQFENAIAIMVTVERFGFCRKRSETSLRRRTRRQEKRQCQGQSSAAESRRVTL